MIYGIRNELSVYDVLNIENFDYLNVAFTKLGFYVPFNSQDHIGTGPQNCHLWDSNPQR